MTQLGEPYGPNTPRVQAFLDDLQKIPWFLHVGTEQTAGPNIRWISSFEDGINLLPETTSSWVGSTQSLKHALEAVQSRHPEVNFAASTHSARVRAYRIVRYKVSMSLAVGNLVVGKAAVTAGRAASELVLQDQGHDSNQYALGLMEWYQKGHWPVGRDEQGVLVVY